MIISSFGKCAHGGCPENWRIEKMEPNGSVLATFLTVWSWRRSYTYQDFYWVRLKGESLTNPNQSVFQRNGNIPVHNQPKSLRLRHHLRWLCLPCFGVPTRASCPVHVIPLRFVTPVILRLLFCVLRFIFLSIMFWNTSSLYESNKLVHNKTRNCYWNYRLKFNRRTQEFSNLVTVSTEIHSINKMLIYSRELECHYEITLLLNMHVMNLKISLKRT